MLRGANGRIGLPLRAASLWSRTPTGVSSSPASGSAGVAGLAGVVGGALRLRRRRCRLRILIRCRLRVLVRWERRIVVRCRSCGCAGGAGSAGCCVAGSSSRSTGAPGAGRPSAGWSSVRRRAARRRSAAGARGPGRRGCQGRGSGELTGDACGWGSSRSTAWTRGRAAGGARTPDGSADAPATRPGTAAAPWGGTSSRSLASRSEARVARDSGVGLRQQARRAVNGLTRRRHRGVRLARRIRRMRRSQRWPRAPGLPAEAGDLTNLGIGFAPPQCRRWRRCLRRCLRWCLRLCDAFFLAFGELAGAVTFDRQVDRRSPGKRSRRRGGAERRPGRGCRGGRGSGRGGRRRRSRRRWRRLGRRLHRRAEIGRIQATGPAWSRPASGSAGAVGSARAWACASSAPAREPSCGDATALRASAPNATARVANSRLITGSPFVARTGWDPRYGRTRGPPIGCRLLTR